MKKKGLSLLLVLCLIIGMIPVAASAEEVENTLSSITTSEGLQQAIDDASNGGTITLGGEIDLGTLENPSEDSGLIKIPAGTNIVLDLAGHTLSGNLVTDGSSYARAHIILIEGTLTIQDSSGNHSGKIVNTNSSSYACTRVLKNTASGNLTITGGTITATSGVGLLNLGICSISGDNTAVEATQTGYSGGWNNAVAAIENRENASLTISGGSFSSTSEAALFVDGGSVLVTGGTFTGNENYGAMNGEPDSYVTVQGGTFSSDPTACVDQLSYVVNEENGYYNVSSVTAQTITVNTAEELKTALNGNQTSIVTIGANFSLSESLNIPVYMKVIIPQGTTFTVDGNAVLTVNGRLENNGAITVRENAFLSKLSNVTGSGQVNTPTINGGVYTISTPMDLQWLTTLLADENQSGITQVVLANDITIPSGTIFESLGAASNITFDGQSHSVMGLTIESIGGDIGLFVSLENSTIKDVTLNNCAYTTQTGYIGGVAGIVSNTTFENVSVSGSISAGASYGVAGITGSVSNGSETDSTVFINCSNQAAIGGSAAYNVGSMFGTASGSSGTIGIYNSSNSGNITAAGSMGYVFGFGYLESDATLEIIGFNNTGKVNNEDGSVSTAIGSGFTYSDDCIDGGEWKAVQRADGTWKAIPVDATIVAEVNGELFATLEEAFSAAETGATITLCDSVSGVATIKVNNGTSLTLDLNGFTIGFKEYNYFEIQNGTLNIEGKGVVREEEPYYSPVRVFGSSDPNATNYSVVKIGENVTLEGYYGLDVNVQSEQKTAYGVFVEVNGTLIGKKDASSWGGVGLYVNGNITQTEGNVPQIIINPTAVLTGEHGEHSQYGASAGMYLAGYAKTAINGGSIEADTGIEIRAGELTVVDGIITGTAMPTEVTPNGNGSTTAGAGIAAAQHTTALPLKVVVSGGVIQGYTAFYQVTPEDNPNIDVIDLSIIGGNYSCISGGINSVYSEDCKGFVSGGYFNSDPTGYLKNGYTIEPSNVADYTYHVVEGGTHVPTEVKPDVAEPAVERGDLTEGQFEQVEKAVSSVEADDALTVASVDQANSIGENEAKDLKEKSTIKPGAEETLNLYVQTFLSVTPRAYETSADGPKTLILDIEPQYQIVASTASDADDIHLTDEEGPVNADVVQEPQKLPGSSLPKTVEITLTLPTGFASESDAVYVHHKGYSYDTTKESSGDDGTTITFTNPHGFSAFTITTDGPAAQIGNTKYATLQDAVNNVQDNDTITLLKDGQTAVVNKAVTFKVDSQSGSQYTATITQGDGFTMTTGDDGTYTVTRIPSVPSTPSQPEELDFPFTDVGDAWYTDAIQYVYENDLMVGTSDTTFEPELKLNRAMAAQILYNLEGQPAVTGTATFTDTDDAGAWAVNAITWAEQNNVVAGIGSGLFDPTANVTREQFAQMMYNYAKFKGYDLTKIGDLSKFPDVGTISDWAETAMSWANGNGLINGHEDSGLIDPAGTTTRAQAASIIRSFDLYVVKAK